MVCTNAIESPSKKLMAPDTTLRRPGEVSRREMARPKPQVRLLQLEPQFAGDGNDLAGMTGTPDPGRQSRISIQQLAKLH